MPDVERVAAEFAAGATIVLQALHLSHLPLALFCRELEARLGHPVQANAYYTPRAAQGLPVHHDTHDVLVLQLGGEKRWLVYDPVLELPLKDQRYSPELGGPGEPVLDLTLRSGDTLYLPRGWLHEGLTSELDSLHLTIGINAYTARDAVRAGAEAAEEELELRRAVQAGGELANDLLEHVAERLDPDAVAARMRERFVSTRRPILDGQLAQLRRLEQLTIETPLERRPSVIADLHADDGGKVVLEFEGKRILFPAHAAEAVELAVVGEAPFTARELPGALDDAGQLVLVRRLIREGFLRAVDG